ncbi:MAG: hypothetical protein GVY32_05705 [Gammaproteobacteria bacterium]|jgi:3-deoxy-D-manno-octulosonate 8-phosphate phosphatase KdsC-like HAD superfamily phosphatase|nr:hypothetical protein [Gammaproteobacteria bacterium]
MIPIRTTMAAIAFVLVSPVGAQQHTKDYSDRLPEDLPEFEQVDSNGDSLIDWEEAEAVGLPREVFEAEQQQGYLSKPTWDYVILRKQP